MAAIGIGWLGTPHARAAETPEGWSVFFSQLPELGVIAACPPGWKAGESRGRTERYTQAYFQAPPGKGDRLVASFTITARPISQTGADARAFLESVIQKRGRLPDADMGILTEVRLPERTANVWQVDLDYGLLTRLSSPRPERVKVRERLLAFVHGEQMLLVSYLAQAELFLLHNGKFERFLKSLRFAD